MHAAQATRFKIKCPAEDNAEDKITFCPGHLCEMASLGHRYQETRNAMQDVFSWGDCGYALYAAEATRKRDTDDSTGDISRSLFYVPTSDDTVKKTPSVIGESS